MREMNVLKKKFMKHSLCFGECYLNDLSRENHKTSSTIPCNEKRSEYYTAVTRAQHFT